MAKVGVVVVDQVEVGVGQALDPGALAVDLDEHGADLLERVARAAVGADADHLRVRGAVRDRGGEHEAVVGPLEREPVDAGGLQPRRAPRLQVAAAGRAREPTRSCEGGVAPGVLGEVRRSCRG